MRTASIACGEPAAKLRCIESAPSGSTPKTSVRGEASFTAAATPAHSPPPPIGTITASRPSACSTSSRPSVAVPSAVFGPSNGWTNVRLSVASISFTRAKAWCTSETSSTVAPSARQPSTRNGFADFGITTLAVVPSTAAAYATAIAWFPALTAVTPRASASGDRSSITASAPRALKLPVRWNSSSLRKTRVSGPTTRLSAPSCQSRTGVVTTRSPRRARVARIASSVGSGGTAVAMGRGRSIGPTWSGLGFDPRRG